MAVSTGNNATLYMGVASDPMVGQGTTSLGGNAYQITTVSRRILDPRVTITVNENGVPANQPYTINTYTGVVQFDSAPTTPITVSANYITLETVGTCEGLTLQIDNSFAEIKTLGVPYVDRELTMRDFSGTIELIDWNTEIDNETLHTLHNGGTPLLLSVAMATGARFYGWVLLTAESVSVSPDDIQRANFGFAGVNLGDEQTVHGYY